MSSVQGWPTAHRGATPFTTQLVSNCSVVIDYTCLFMFIYVNCIYMSMHVWVTRMKWRTSRWLYNDICIGLLGGRTGKRPSRKGAETTGIPWKPPRPLTLIFFFLLSIYKIRETISGQCWFTVCDAGPTLAERLLYILGRSTICNIWGHLIRRIIDCHLSPTTVLH